MPIHLPCHGATVPTWTKLSPITSHCVKGGSSRRVTRSCVTPSNASIRPGSLFLVSPTRELCSTSPSVPASRIVQARTCRYLTVSLPGPTLSRGGDDTDDRGVKPLPTTFIDHVVLRKLGKPLTTTPNNSIVCNIRKSHIQEITQQKYAGTPETNREGASRYRKAMWLLMALQKPQKYAGYCESAAESAYNNHKQ